MAINIDDPRDIQQGYDDRFNDITAKEHGATADSTPDYSQTNDELASYNNDSNASDTLNDAETGTAGTWNTHVVGTGKTTGKTIDLIKKVALKRSGPTAAISGILIAGGISLSLIFSPAMLLVHIKEVILDRFNIQNTAIDVRTNKILSAKLSTTVTSGCSGVIKITCKFNKMSNAALQRMADEGIVAYDKNGNALDLKDGKWGTQRPYEFRPSAQVADEFTLPSGSKGVAAADFTQFLNDNPAASGVYRRAFNPRWTEFWDSTFAQFLDRVGFGTKAAKITGDTDKAADDSVQAVKDKASGDTHSSTIDNKSTKENETNADGSTNTSAKAANEAVNTEANSADNVIKSAAGATDSSIVDSVKKLDSPLLIVNLACLTSSSGTISKGLRAIQVAQLISFGVAFFQVADEIKAGKATAAVTSAVGSQFTQSLVSSKGTVVKKSAMESDGMLYALEGNTKATSTTSNYQQWLPGGGAVSFLNAINTGVAKALGTNGKNTLDKACSVVNSTAGQIASGGLTLAMSFTPLGFISAGLQVFFATDAGSNLLSKAIAPLLKMLAGEVVDKTIANEDFGNAVSIGMVQSVSEGGNAGATMPLSVDQAVAYSQATTQDQLANARIDQATLSPFDTSSPNTFLGSIVTRLTPYYGMVSSGPFGALGAITNVVGATFSSLLTPGAFADSSKSRDDYTRCPDTSISDAGIAAGMLCEVQYGIPVTYLNSIDPTTNTAQLVQDGQIDDDGNPISTAPKVISGSDGATWNLNDYISNCARGDGTTATTACMITGKDQDTKASWAVYTIDHRIQKNMDGEETYGGSS